MKKPTLDWIPNIFSVFVSYYVQTYALDLRKQLLHPTVKRLNKLCFTSIFIELVIFMTFCSCYYLAMGDKFTPELALLRKPFPNK